MLGCINQGTSNQDNITHETLNNGTNSSSSNETQIMNGTNGNITNESATTDESEGIGSGETNQTQNEQTSNQEEEVEQEDIYLKVGGLTTQFTKNDEVSFFVQSENADCSVYLNNEKIKDLPHFGIRASQNVIIQLNKKNANNTIDVICKRDDVVKQWHMWVVWDTVKPYWKGNEINVEFEDGLLKVSWPEVSDISPVTYHVRITYDYFDYKRDEEKEAVIEMDTSNNSWEEEIDGTLKEVQVRVSVKDAAGNIADAELFKRFEFD